MDALRIAVYAGAFTALLGAVGLFLRSLVSLWRFARKADQVISAAVIQAEFLKTDPEALPRLLKIAEQFETNHGTTLRDAIDRIEASVAAHGTELSELRARLEAGDLHFVAIDKRMVELWEGLLLAAKGPQR